MYTYIDEILTVEKLLILAAIKLHTHRDIVMPVMDNKPQVASVYPRLYVYECDALT